MTYGEMDGERIHVHPSVLEELQGIALMHSYGSLQH